MSEGSERYGRPTGDMDELAERMKQQPEIDARSDELAANAAAPGEAGQRARWGRDFGEEERRE